MKIQLLFLLSFFAMASCKKSVIRGEGQVATERRAISGFEQITVSGATSIYISKKDSFSVEVKAFANLLPYLQTTVSNNKLKIGFEPGSSILNDNSEARISMPHISELATYGSANIIAGGSYQNNVFTAITSGSGNIFAPAGTADQLKLTLEGSGSIDAMEMVAVDATIYIEGSGQAFIHLTGKLNVKILGSGVLFYKGNPVSIASDIQGSGKLIELPA